MLRGDTLFRTSLLRRGDLESRYHARSSCKSGPADAQFPGDSFRLRRWRHIKPGRHVNDVQNPAACESTITIDATGLSVTMPPIDSESIATSASVRTKLTFYRYWQGASGSGERATWAPGFVSALPQIPVEFRHTPRQARALAALDHAASPPPAVFVQSGRRVRVSVGAVIRCTRAPHIRASAWRWASEKSRTCHEAGE